MPNNPILQFSGQGLLFGETVGVCIVTAYLEKTKMESSKKNSSWK